MKEKGKVRINRFVRQTLTVCCLPLCCLLLIYLSEMLSENNTKMNGHLAPEKEKADSTSYLSNSKAKLAHTLEDGPETPYEPGEHRDFPHALGTPGALFHMIKGSLGSGILSMPVAFKNGGLWVSLVGALFIGVICTHCVHLLVLSSQTLSKKMRQPSLDYAGTAEAAFVTGPAKLRKYSVIVREFVDSALMITYYFGTTVYIVFIASTTKQIVESHWNVDINPRLYVLMTALVIVPVGSIRRLKFLVPFSFVAIIFLFIGCTFVLYEVFSDLPPFTSRPAFTSIQRLPLFYATVLFALEGIGTVLPIENVMKKPQHFLGCPGVLNVAMTVLVFIYTIMGFFGYLKYGEETAGSISLNLNSSVIGEVVKVLVALNVLCSYGLCFCVPSEIVWRKLNPRVREENKTRAYYTMRILMILSAVVVACALPDLEPFVGLCGAICYSTLGLLFPSVIDLVTFWEDKEYMGPGRWKLYKNVFLMLMWLIALTAGTQASVAKIVETYA
ncbi:proton-coupled amino acid transporter-like protein pathetic isoform X1 [Homalodisca vitripennis]|nr:proton-coupled amino acid transporter-like protein pathetic isoform X1 [Homalodisca vitripennis]